MRDENVSNFYFKTEIKLIIYIYEVVMEVRMVEDGMIKDDER